MRRIRIKAGAVTVSGRLNDSETATAVWNALPLRSSVNTWGDEIYFPIPVSVGAENPRDVVDLGDIAYWPPGKSLCVFFGPTPASRGKEIRPASSVNIIGQIEGDPRELRNVASGAPVEVERA